MTKVTNRLLAFVLSFAMILTGFTFLGGAVEVNAEGGQTDTITIKVVDQNGNGVEGVSLICTDADDNDIDFGTTGDDGTATHKINISFEYYEEGDEYEITAEDCTVTSPVKFTIVEFQSGERTGMFFDTVNGEEYTGGTVNLVIEVEEDDPVDVDAPYDANDFTYGEYELGTDPSVNGVNSVYPGNDMSYMLPGTKWVVTGFSESGAAKFKAGHTDLVIPAKDPDGRTVQGVGDYAFQAGASNKNPVIAESGKKVTGVTFPSGIMTTENISDINTKWAAYLGKHGPLTEVGDFIIGYFAFGSNDITGELVIPEGTILITNSAFQANKKITKVSFPSTMININKMAFAACTNLDDLSFPAETDIRLSIRQQAFFTDGMTAVVLPKDTLQVQGGNAPAFRNNTGTATPTAITIMGKASNLVESNSYQTVNYVDAVEAVEAVEPTCDTDGNTTAYKCLACGKFFSDEDLTQEVEDITIPAGHKWGNPTYVWADDNSTCTATRVCERVDSHKEQETATATSAEADGFRTHTAAFANPAFETQTKQEDLAVEDAVDKINALPDKDSVTYEDKEKIAGARTAYDALSPEQKALIDDETLKKLTDAEKVIKDFEDAGAAERVEQVINALPAADKVTTADKAKIEAARKAYNALTADQKELINADVLSKLTTAETALGTALRAEAAADEAKAKSVTTVVENDPTVDAAAIDRAVKQAGGSNKYVTKIVLGSKVKKISSSALAKYPQVKTIEVRTKKLTKKSVKKSLKGSNVKTVKVKVSNKAKINKKYVKKYKKIFTKKNAGRKVKVTK